MTTHLLLMLNEHDLDSVCYCFVISPVLERRRYGSMRDVIMTSQKLEPWAIGRDFLYEIYDHIIELVYATL